MDMQKFHVTETERLVENNKGLKSVGRNNEKKLIIKFKTSLEIA